MEKNSLCTKKQNKTKKRIQVMRTVLKISEAEFRMEKKFKGVKYEGWFEATKSGGWFYFSC